MEADASAPWCVLELDDGGSQDLGGVSVRCLPFRIGRGGGSDLLLRDTRVWERACELLQGEKGRLELAATSKGGVYVNEVLVREGHRRVLVEGDRLRMVVAGGKEKQNQGPTFRVRHLRDGGEAGGGDMQCGEAALKSMDDALQCSICMCTVTPCHSPLTDNLCSQKLCLKNPRGSAAFIASMTYRNVMNA